MGWKADKAYEAASSWRIGITTFLPIRWRFTLSSRDRQRAHSRWAGSPVAVHRSSKPALLTLHVRLTPPDRSTSVCLGAHAATVSDDGAEIQSLVLMRMGASDDAPINTSAATGKTSVFDRRVSMLPICLDCPTSATGSKAVVVHRHTDNAPHKQKGPGKRLLPRPFCYAKTSA